MPENQKSDVPKPAPPLQKAKNINSQLALAMELPFVFVGAVAVGAFLGYFLDRWLHTSHIFLLILGGLGFVGGLREVLRRLPTNDNGPKGR